MNAFTERGRELPARRRALLEALLAEDGIGVVPQRTIPPRGSTGPARLSFAQQRLWFLDQFTVGNAAYNIMAALRLKGPLNIVALEQSLHMIVERHESLRTTFRMQGDDAVAVVLPAVDIPLVSVDLRSVPFQCQDVEVQHRIRAEATSPFNLSHDVLMRCTLLVLANDEHILLLTMHHIISDGWSAGVLFSELSSLYESYLTNTQQTLPPLPIQYADYAEWQRDQMQGTVLDEQLSYWREQLAGAPGTLELPVVHPRPAVQTHTSASIFFPFPDALVTGLKQLGQREGVTLFMTLLAAFQIVLARYTGEHDIVVGTPIAGRTHPELEGLIGFFANTLVLRTKLDDNLSCRALLHQVRETCLGAYAHQDLPFERLVQELQPERDMSRTPLFQVLFDLQPTGVQLPNMPELVVEEVDGAGNMARFELELHLIESGSTLRGRLTYNVDLFDAAMMHRLIGHYETVLGGIVANPTQRLAALPLLTAPERTQLLRTWNATDLPPAPERFLHQLIEAQVERTPEAIAVRCGATTLSYRALDAQATLLAAHLRARGVGPEVRVALCLDRSPRLLVALLAILKAGGAYVPLDPAFPPARLAAILSAAHVALLLTESALADTVRALWAAPPAAEAPLLPEVPCLDLDDPALAAPPPPTPPSAHPTLSPSNLAYVLFTSGSTGQPKGVAISHQAVVNFLLAMRQAPGLPPDAHMLALTTLAFDIAGLELYLPLCVGACVEIVSRTVASDGVLLAQHIEQSGATVLQGTPTTWRLLLAAGWSAAQRPTLLCGGEPLPPDLAQQLLQRGRAVWNLYGPTETTIWSTAQQLETGAAVTIGRPIANTQTYVLDAAGELVPIGVTGELYIGGWGLARGYLERPDLTAASFVPDRYSGVAGARLYRTGDLARYRPDGQLEHLGRRDQQVKIRGYRIELGEIEAVLAQSPLVRDAIVMVREDQSGHRRLVAYIVGENADASSVNALRQFVAQHLPEYMVPATFVVLPSVPLTPNGKVDRAALPAPESDRPALDIEYAGPRTPVEERLIAIWSQVLGLQQVGIHDNFFALGGDSILSIQIVARAAQQGLHFTPRDLFAHQTIAELAIVATPTVAPYAEQGIVTGVVPLTPIQHWFFAKDLVEKHHWNQAMLLEADLALDPVVLELALRHILAHHDALRLRFMMGSAGWQQINADPDDIGTVLHIDLSQVPEQEQATAFEVATSSLQTSLDLTEGPLLRAGLFDMGAGRPNRLLIIIHHLVVDSISWRIILEDLEVAYQQLCRGATVTLPPKTTSFQQWAQLLVEYAQSSALQHEAGFWFGRPWTEVVQLPVDNPGEANTPVAEATVSVSLNADETQSLLTVVPQAYRTQINDVLLTALAQAFAEWTGSQTLLVALEGHGREEVMEGVDLSRTVGWFTSLFPVLLQLTGSAAIEDDLKAIKEQLRALPNRGLGYGVLRYLSPSLEIRRQVAALPQAEVSFNYLGQFDQVLPHSSLFTRVSEHYGPVRSPHGHRPHLLAIDGLITAGQLQLHWTYSRALHQRATVERLAQGFLNALRALIHHCQSPTATGYTPSDFPAMQFSQEELDDLIAIVSGSMEDRE